MTLEEMSKEYRAQTRIIHQRILELRDAMQQAETTRERDELWERIRALAPIWRETRELAALLEHYYERGYRRNGRYTL